MKSWSNFQNFLTYRKAGDFADIIGLYVVKFAVKFYTESSLMAVSAHAH